MNTGVTIDDGAPINCLLYADDIALVAKSAEDAQRLADEAQRWADTYQLRINAAKTEYLALGARRTHTITLAGATVEAQDNIKYLGFQKSAKDKTLHPTMRLQKAETALRNIQKIFRGLPDIPAQHKLLTAQACVDAVYLYGLEVTSGKKLDKIMKKANVVRRRALRTIMQAPMGTANEILQVDAGWSRIETLIAARKVKMVKRIVDKEPGAIVRRILEKAAL